MTVTEKKARKAAAKTKASATRWRDALPSREDLQKLKKAALIREAGRAFKAKGFHQTSLDEVAEALNVTKAALYYYVKGKRELLYETQALALDMGDEALEYGRQGKTGREKLERTLSRYIEYSSEDYGSHMIWGHLEDMLPEHGQVIRQRLRDFDQAVRGFVEEGIKDGSISPCDPKLVIAWIMGAINWIPHWYKEGSPYHPDGIAQTFLQLMFSGLAPASAPAGKRAASPRKG